MDKYTTQDLKTAFLATLPKTEELAAMKPEEKAAVLKSTETEVNKTVVANDTYALIDTINDLILKIEQTRLSLI
jgi:hypothetical protein